MYVEKDTTGHLIIQKITPEEAELLNWCICKFFADQKKKNRTKEEKSLIVLKREIDKLI